MKNCKIDIQLSERNRARLESRNYDRAYTDIPNRALPANYREELDVIHTALTGSGLPEDSSTFTVRADATGTFKRLYSPTVFSTEDRGLIIRWGGDDISLAVDGGKVTAPTADKKTKFAFKEEQIGKYPETVLSVSYSKDGTLFTMPFPVRSADWENRVNADILEVLLDENPDAISEHIAVATDPSKRGEGNTGPRLEGYFVKVSELPVGNYSITNYRSKEGNFGTDYFLQAVIEEPFVATSRIKGDDGEWVDAEVEVKDFAVIRPNGQLKKLLAAEPIISPENPATIQVVSHGEWNGYKTAKVNLRCSAFVEDDGSFALDF